MDGNGMGCAQKLTAKDYLRAIQELGEGTNQRRISEYFNLSVGFISELTRRLIKDGLVINSNAHDTRKPYVIKLTEKGRALIGETSETKKTDAGSNTSTIEEIILRMSRTIERLLEENDRLKQDNEKTQRLVEESDELLRENLKLEEEVKKLQSQRDFHKEEALQLRNLKCKAPYLTSPKVENAMAVFGD